MSNASDTLHVLRLDSGCLLTQQDGRLVTFTNPAEAQQAAGVAAHGFPCRTVTVHSASRHGATKGERKAYHALLEYNLSDADKAARAGRCMDFKAGCAWA